MYLFLIYSSSTKVYRAGLKEKLNHPALLAADFRYKFLSRVCTVGSNTRALISTYYFSLHTKTRVLFPLK